jgi:hypothetical protein
MKLVISSVACVAAVVAALATGAAPAMAHEGPGRLTIESAEPSGDTVTYRVRLVYTGDDDPVDDATITAVVDGVPSATPQPFAPAGTAGIYEATVRLPGPGTWTIRFTSVTPPATAERTETLVAAVTTTSSAPSPSTTVARAGADPPGGTDDDGSSKLPLVVGAAAAAAVVAAAVYAALRRRAS